MRRAPLRNRLALAWLILRASDLEVSRVRTAFWLLRAKRDAQIHLGSGVYLIVL